MVDDHSPGERPSSHQVGGSDGDWELIDRYVAGECSPEQVTQVERLLKVRPDLMEIVVALRAALQAGPEADSRSGWDAEAASARLARTIDGDAGASHRASTPLRVVHAVGERPRFDIANHPGTARRNWLAAAAAVMVLAVGAGLFSTELRDRAKQEPVPAAAPMREIVTRRGQRALFNLSDGSRVVLAAESRLRIPPGYNTPANRGRPVYLEGQAYFVVRHDSTRPFEVRTAAGIAQDLGTEFVVTAYPETQGMRVAVSEGIVALRSRSADSTGTSSIAPVDTAPLLTLVQGDLASLDTAGVATLTRGADLRPYLAWADGSLIFDGTRLDDALHEIGRWYDLEIRLADPSLAGRQLTATFTNEAAPQVLERIARILRLEVRRNGRTVTLAVPPPAQSPL